MSGIRKKTAVITGVNGQDGSYLAELLLDKGYQVIGVIRRSSQPEFQSHRLDECMVTTHPGFQYVYGDLLDLPSLLEIFRKYKPSEIYNLAAQSHVGISFSQPLLTTQVDAVGTLNILEAFRHIVPNARFYQAGSSEMFGNSIDEDGFQRETTPMHPVSPYGCAKLYAYNICKTYRDAYGLFISNGILFNHESPRRGLNFVTNKVIDAAVKISKKKQEKLYLGNLEACRDWGHAKDYVKAMWMMLQSDEPDDFVCATGQSRSVRELCSFVFSYLNLNYEDYVEVDEKYVRPEELDALKGDSSKLREGLGWEPQYNFGDLMLQMIRWRAHCHDDSLFTPELQYP
jgi:GDPmannose 4,6-dehydratase